MLQTLSDFFLLISTDKNTITSKDLSIFYNFITKKMPQIQQQNPTLISSLLLAENNNKIENIDLRDYSEKFFIDLQKQIMNLINDLIDYCYERQIIKLTMHCEKLIKEKINEKIDNNNISKIDKILKEEKRNFILFLIINEGISFSISPRHFVNFFNSENKKIIRNIVEIFIKFIKSLTKYYTKEKKHTRIQKKKIKKSNTHIMKDIKNNKKENSKCGVETNKSNYSSKKNQLTNSLVKKNNSLINEQNKILSTLDINNSINLGKSKISNKNSGNLNNVKKKLQFNSKSETTEDEVNDTFLCDTPNNISLCDKKISAETSSYKKIPEIKQTPKHLNKENISSISYNKYRNSKTLSTNGASDIISFSDQKENPTDFSKKLKQIKEIIDIENNSITLNNLNNDKNIEKINVNGLKGKKINSEKNNNYLKGYNIVRSCGVNEKNENYKESIVYKNYEMHEHLVVFDNPKKRDYIEEDEIIGCTAF